MTDNPAFIDRKPIGQPEDARQRQIETITQTDKQAFESWLKEKPVAPTLDIPHGALRYVLIPRRILELVDDPSTVDILVTKHDPDGVKAYVFERKRNPITNKQSLETYWQDEEKRYAEESAKAQAEGSLFIHVSSDPPADVNRDHAHNQQLIVEEKLQLNDLISNEISLQIAGEKDLYQLLVAYYDRDHFRNKKVAPSFYARLREVAREMGFRFIKGANNLTNIGFFTKKLGRHTLA